MRVLWICPTLPFPATNGQQLRNSAMLRALVETGNEVTVVCFEDPHSAEAAQPFQKQLRGIRCIPHQLAYQATSRNYGARLRNMLSGLPYGVSRYRSAAMHAAISEALTAGPADCILCEGVHTGINLPDPPGAPLIVDNHNLEHVLLERYARLERNPAKQAYALLEARKLRSWEIRLNRKASGAMACSGHDRELLAASCPELPIAVVPNIVDTEAYVPAAGLEDGTILFSGGLDWFPNQQAVEYLAWKILPELRKLAQNFRVVIAGRAPSAEFCRRFASIPEMRFTGRVPDMRVEIARADICVVPLQVGSGTRLKILEAAAMGKAIVSTRLGAEGLDFADDREILLADTPEAFARAIADLLESPGRRRAIGQAARERTVISYSFPAMRQAIADFLATTRLLPTSNRP